MKVLLDEGLPWAAAECLAEKGLTAFHVSDVGLSQTPDEAILDYARLHDYLLVTLDSDFHEALALAGSTNPSVIRFRIQGMPYDEIAKMILNAIDQFGDQLKTGAMVTITRNGMRARSLPITRHFD